MKRTLAVLLAVATLAAVLVLSPTGKKSIPSLPVVHAQDGNPGCSLPTVAGNYGFTINGTLILPTGGVPVAAIGRATFGANGGFSGTETRSLGGGVAEEMLEGTYKVNPDCTGSLTATVSESGTLVRTSGFALVFDDNAREGRAIQTSLVLPDGTGVPNVITIEARKITPNSGE
jgi:hypothetical protein